MAFPTQDTERSFMTLTTFSVDTLRERNTELLLAILLTLLLLYHLLHSISTASVIKKKAEDGWEDLEL